MRPIDATDSEPIDEVEAAPPPSRPAPGGLAARRRSDREVVRFETDRAVPPGSSLLRGLLYGVPISLALWALILWLLLF